MEKEVSPFSSFPAPVTVIIRRYSFMKCYRLFPWICLALVFVPGFTLPAENVIDIKSSQTHIATIAIPDFFRKDGDLTLKKGAFSNIIYHDLELSGSFQKPENDKFVAETHRSDQSDNKIDFAEWRRLGCTFLLKADYTLTDSSLSVSCYLYDVKTSERIFGKRFPDYKKEHYRRLAHLISDEIVRYITQYPGIASTKISFISNRKNSKEVYIMDADGFGQRPVTRDSSLAATPCWGKSVTEIYYTSYKEYNPDLWVIRLSDLKAGVVSSYPGFNLSPSWCKKNEKICLTLSKDGNSEIYSMDSRGKNPKRLTFNRAIDSSPSWSPNGDRIVFTSDRSGSPQIYVMDSEGLNARRITKQGSYNDSAVWSPDGSRIAFVARTSGSFHIYIMNIDGTNWKRLTSGYGNNEDPGWAPDGRHICFTSDRRGKPQIYVMNDDGSNQEQLTFSGSNQSPSWSSFRK
jgi:TolB protein